MRIRVYRYHDQIAFDISEGEHNSTQTVYLNTIIAREFLNALKAGCEDVSMCQFSKSTFGDIEIRGCGE